MARLSRADARARRYADTLVTAMLIAALRVGAQTSGTGFSATSSLGTDGVSCSASGCEVNRDGHPDIPLSRVRKNGFCLLDGNGFLAGAIESFDPEH
jgi:hypothetical protein